MLSENSKLTTWFLGPSFLHTNKYQISTIPDGQLHIEDLETQDRVIITAETPHFVDSIVERYGHWNQLHLPDNLMKKTSTHDAGGDVRNTSQMCSGSGGF